MKLENTHFTNYRGHKIYQQAWLPESTPKALVFILHGMGEHSGRYAALAQYLADQGFACYGLDHFAHGNSDGERGFIPDFNILTETANQFIEDIKARRPDLPSFIVGHSMGGVITSNLLIDNPRLVNGAVLSGPALATDGAVGPVQRWILSVLSLALPRLPIFQLEPTLVCSDPAVVAGYLDDPLVHAGKMTPRIITGILKAADRALKGAANITTPMLLLHGEQDALASPEGSRRLYRDISSTDKELCIYPELYHEIFHEPCKMEIFAKIAAWMDARLSASQSV